MYIKHTHTHKALHFTFASAILSHLDREKQMPGKNKAEETPCLLHSHDCPTSKIKNCHTHIHTQTKWVSECSCRYHTHLKEKHPPTCGKNKNGVIFLLQYEHREWQSEWNKKYRVRDGRTWGLLFIVASVQCFNCSCKLNIKSFLSTFSNSVSNLTCQSIKSELEPLFKKEKKQRKKEKLGPKLTCNLKAGCKLYFVSIL